MTTKKSDVELTDAQKAQSEATGIPVPATDALTQAAEDAKARRDEPNKPVAREANSDFGGESFDYLKNVSG